MAGRNRKNNAEYFSHDADASSDEKIIYLESVFGHKGYAIYFKFLERMVRSENFEIDWNDIKKTIYAAEFNISVTEIEQIVSECCREEIKAFQVKDGKLFSNGLKKRMQPLLDKRDYNRKKYETKKSNKTNALPNSVTERGISVDEMTHNKVKESKVKESKGKKNLEKKLFEKITENNLGQYSESIMEFFNYRYEIKKPYKTDRGINGLIKDICGCKEKGLDIVECLTVAMQKEWQTPSPNYYKKGNIELSMAQKAF